MANDPKWQHASGSWKTGTLPTPDDPGLGLHPEAFSTEQKDQYAGLTAAYGRLLDWQAELTNRQTAEDRNVYCEELDAWREQVRAFRNSLLPPNSDHSYSE